MKFDASMTDDRHALVLGGNVVGSLPQAADLLLVERWRPAGGWLRCWATTAAASSS